MMERNLAKEYFKRKKLGTYMSVMELSGADGTPYPPNQIPREQNLVQQQEVKLKPATNNKSQG